ncbi:MAG: GldG family protein [Alphaproteobacteria bacterium]
MAQGTNRSGVLALTSLVVIAVGFIATVMLVNTAFKSARLDLTDDGLFTLAAGTKNVIDSIDEPVTLRFYFSDRLAREIPQIGIYGQRVQDMLEEFAARGKGKIQLEIQDPLPFTDIEDRAVAYGLKGVPVDQTGETVYFGLAGVNSTDHQLSIPFFDEKREKFLEYDLARMIYGLANPNKPKVGVITKLPVSGSRYARSQPNAPDDSWMVWAQSENLFDLEEIDPLTEALPKDLDLLVMIHPPFMSKLALYAVDQYVLNGGKLIIFVDPHSEADASRPPQGRGGNRQVDFGSANNLTQFFDTWGVEVPSDQLVGDLQNGQKVRAPDESRTRVQAILYPLWMQLRKGEFSATDIATSQLDVFRIASPGHIIGKEGGLTIEPLIQTSELGGVTGVARVQGQQPDIVGIANTMKAEGRKIISARLSGKAKTAFPDGPPQPIAMKDDDASAEDKAKAKVKWEQQKTAHLAEAKENVAIVLTADVDMLADGLWVRVQDMFGQRIAVPTANNGAFFQNLLENMTGSSDLIGLRSRGGFQRPFTLIEEIQRGAEQSFRAKEQELLENLAQAEKELGQIQQTSNAAGETQLVLSDTQRADIEKFQDKMLSIRKELRNVQFALRSDVEELNGKIKAINIGGMPLVVAVLALLGAYIRTRRRKKFQADFPNSVTP